VFWISYTQTTAPPFLAVAGSIATFTFFIYKAAAGGLFATTSVKVAHVGSLSDENSCMLRITLKRGSNWLVDIDWVGVALVDELPNTRNEWNAIPFPTTRNGRTRLGPLEETSTMHTVPWPSNVLGSNGVVNVTVNVISYAVLWPTPARSVAHIIILLRSLTRVCATLPHWPESSAISGNRYIR
jgi:hypothetical protein